MDSTSFDLNRAWADARGRWEAAGVGPGSGAVQGAAPVHPAHAGVHRSRPAGVLDRADRTFLLSHLMTAVNVIPLGVLAVLQPLPWLRLGLAVVIGYNLIATWQLVRIQQRLRAARHHLDLPLAQYLRRTADALRDWQRAQYRHGWWQLPFSGGLGMAFGIWASQPPGLAWHEIQALDEPLFWAIAIANLILLSLLSQTLVRTLFRKSFGKDETNLRNWADELAGEGEGWPKFGPPHERHPPA